MAKQRVIVAMSGGVDSSVAAGLLQRVGCEVMGVFMCLVQAEKTVGTPHGCYSPENSRDASEVAGRLGIRLCVLNFQKELEAIIDYFVDEYRRGRTPNPCVVCNSRLKFGKLIEYAQLTGAEYLATGHYARIKAIGGYKRLCRGIDTHKDQSYALFGMSRDKLKKILLPVGEYTKDQVRELAVEMNLPVYDKGESQDICFVADNDYTHLVAARAPELCRPGPVIDATGKVLGEHQGVYRYTIGQRRGLGIARGKPAYVIRLDAARNTVVLGSREELLQRRLEAREVNWLVEPVPTEPFAATVQIRYNHRAVKGQIRPLIGDRGKYDRVVVEFAEPISAITPGQAAVFYNQDNQVVLGGGWIESGR